MKININNLFGDCNVVSSNGVTIINGRVVNGKGNKKSKAEEFDEKKVENANKIEQMVIDSSIGDINVLPSESSNVEVHFYGSAILDKDIDFDVKLVGSELRITVKHSGNCSASDLKLDIEVPVEKTFKLISANTMSGDIILSEKVSAENLKIKTQSGDVESYAKLKDISVKTMNGDVELVINAKNDIDLDINTMNGDVRVELYNISRLKKVSTNTMNGNVRNHYRENNEGYTANINISTMNGNIRIS